MAVLKGIGFGLRRLSLNRALRRFVWRTVLIVITMAFLSLLGTMIYGGAAMIAAERTKYMYFPETRISLLARANEVADNQEEDRLPIGGGSAGILPLDIKYYRVKKGDTLSEIAMRFGMDLDTVASLNREWGSGVHLISIGEKIKIPNQDGIYIKIDGSLETLCREKEVPQEVVLQVNRVAAEDVYAGLELFFPGVQHTGVERSVMTGTAFLRPISGFISSGFGYRTDPFTKKIKFHRGIDIAAPVGTAVRASLDGRVVSIGYNPLFGNHIFIRHQIGFSTLYGHLERVFVQRGSTVSRGQPIGSVGNTGKSTGPHLHFEIRKNGVPIQPKDLITPVF